MAQAARKEVTTRQNLVEDNDHMRGCLKALFERAMIHDMMHFDVSEHGLGEARE